VQLVERTKTKLKSTSSALALSSSAYFSKSSISRAADGSHSVTLQDWSSTGANLNNGATIGRVRLTATFYQEVCFNPNIWDLGAPVTRNGWPTLRNVGGPQ